MLSSFGKVFSVNNQDFSLPTGHVTFIADSIRTSLITVTLAADDLKIVTQKYSKTCYTQN